MAEDMKYENIGIMKEQLEEILKSNHKKYERNQKKYERNMKKYERTIRRNMRKTMRRNMKERTIRRNMTCRDMAENVNPFSCLLSLQKLTGHPRKHVSCKQTG